MDKKIGVYLCSGCGIGDAVDMDKLAEVATSEMKAPVCKKHDMLCEPEGAQVIRDDLEKEGVNSVVIAACSPRAKTDVFNFGPEVFVERVNLREQVAWCLPPGDDDTQMAAEDYLRMGIVKAQKANVPEPYMEEIDKTILVVGGGPAGMNSALEAARAGYRVVLVEKEPELGGFPLKTYRQYPHQAPFSGLHPVDQEGIISALNADDKIRVLLGAEVQKIAGAPGMFDVTIKANGSEETLRAGAVVQATGWKPYDPNRLGHLGYGRLKNVVTSVELEEMAAGNGITRPSDGGFAGSVAFIQCAGSRDPQHLPYCSSVCCMVSLKQALYIHEKSPEAPVYIVYKDMRTPGPYEYYYKQVQEDPSVFLTKGDVTAVEEDEQGKVLVTIDDKLLGGPVQLEVDLLVLATGMVPTVALDKEMSPEFQAERAPTESADEKEEEKSEEEEHLEVGMATGPPMALHLEYRQGPELPRLKYGMPDSHFICFPYETRRTGIYAAGTLRNPMDAQEAQEDAAGATLKAIQCVEMTSRGEAVHPRAGDRSYPELFMQRCTQCKRCTEECPFGMYNEDEKANPLPNPTRCRRCAVCMGSCPERIISFKDYSVDIIGSMIKAMEVPEEDEEKPRVLVLACENDAYPCLDMLGQKHLQWNPYARIIPLRCVGSLNLVWIADALSKGIDGVLLLGCRHGDDYQCHMITGSELASYRLSKVSETLDRLMLESDRVHFEQVEITDFNRIPGVMSEFMERLEEVGPNPYKGF